MRRVISASAESGRATPRAMKKLPSTQAAIEPAISTMSSEPSWRKGAIASSIERASTATICASP